MKQHRKRASAVAPHVVGAGLGLGIAKTPAEYYSYRPEQVKKIFRGIRIGVRGGGAVLGMLAALSARSAMRDVKSVPHRRGTATALAPYLIGGGLGAWGARVGADKVLINMGEGGARVNYKKLRRPKSQDKVAQKALAKYVRKIRLRGALAGIIGGIAGTGVGLGVRKIVRDVRKDMR